MYCYVEGFKASNEQKEKVLNSFGLSMRILESVFQDFSFVYKDNFREDETTFEIKTALDEVSQIWMPAV